MDLRPNVDTLLMVVLAPLLVAQTLWVRRRAMKLPEPNGARSGAVGSGPPLRLLVLGDSSAAGVGVTDQAQALTPQLANHLCAKRRVHWYLRARNGATAADARELLAPLAGQQFDLAYVIFGVNDTKNLRPERVWRRDLTALVRHLRQHHAVPLIVFSGLPRMQDFPLLPEPMRSILGLRALRFDRALSEVAAQHDGCSHLPLDTALNPSGMSVDGFHPGAAIYAQWAQVAAQRIAPLLESPSSG